MTLGTRLSRLLDHALNTGALIAGACLLFQVVSVSLDVILRYFFLSPIKGVIAFNEWSLLYVAFLGAGWLQREAGHVRVDILLNLFGRRTRLAAELLGIFLGIATCVILVWFGTALTWEKYEQEVYDFFKLEGVVIWPVYLVIPVGGLLWLLQLLRDGTRTIRAEREDRSARMTDL